MLLLLNAAERTRFRYKLCDPNLAQTTRCRILPEQSILIGTCRGFQYNRISSPTRFTLADIFARSRAIMCYLVNQYGKNDSLYPKDTNKRAVVDQRLYFDAGTLDARNSNYTVRIACNSVTSVLG